MTKSAEYLAAVAFADEHFNLACAEAEAARKTGTINTERLGIMGRAITREAGMMDMVAYLKGKDISKVEKARAAKLLKTPTPANDMALRKMVEPYKRGDLPQMVEALKGLNLSRVDRAAIECADDDGAGTVSLSWWQLSKIAADHGITLNLKTVRVEKCKPQYRSTRIDLNEPFPNMR